MHRRFWLASLSPMKKYLSLLICLLLCSVSAAAEHAYELNKYYVIEQGSSWSVEDAQQQTFTPYQQDLSLGFQDGPVWLRLDIRPVAEPHAVDANAPAQTSPMILRLGPYVLDSAVLYEPDGAGWRAQATGDRVGTNPHLCPDGLHCMALHSSPHEPVSLYVKVQQRGVFTVQAEVVASRDLATVVAQKSAKNGAAMAVSISLLLLGIVLLLVERSLLLLVFCFFEIMVVLLVVATTGLVTQHLNFISPPVLDVITHQLFNLRVMMFVLVGWAVIAHYHPPKQYNIMILMLTCLNLLAAVLISMTLIKWAIVVYLSVTGLNLLVQVYGLVVTRGMSPKIRILLGVSYGVYILVFCNVLLNLFPEMFTARPVSNLNSFSDWRVSGGPAGLVIFLFVIIHNAERKLADSKALGQLKVQAAQAMANADKLSERQTLIDMLTHELKNPLGTIRFALATLKRQAHSDEDTLQRVKRMDMSVERMNDLIEQVAGSNKIDRFQLSAPLEMIDAAEFIQDFISDEHADPRFQLNVAPGAKFHSHRRMLTLIVENLIANAAKYADPHQVIAIHVTSNPLSTDFHVRNTVPAGQMPDPQQLFKRYYRHDQVQDLPGLGLGLSLVQTASEKIGAQISFVIDDNHITFTLKVPA
jgi:two-component system, sensor histidine kinase LadS